MKKKLSLVLATLMLLGLLAGCGGQPAASGDKDTVVVYIGDIFNSMTPYMTTANSDQAVFDQVYETLTVTKDDGTVAPCLAKSWKMSDDSLEYFGGKVDAVIMRLADILLSFPDILVALFIMTMFGRGVSKLLVVFTIIGCVTYIRTVRAEVLTVKQMEYVDAARVIGLPNILIIAKHVLPNVMTTVIVLSTMKVGGLILAEATLSFLGVGVPVTEPSLGMLVKNGFDVLFSGYWWIAVMPGLYIMLIVFGINLLGDFLRDEFNPKLK